jgi:hypothetical protein
MRPFPTIAPSVVGDVVTLPDPDSSTVRVRHVGPRCCLARTVMLACLSCRQPLANAFQLLLHLEASPDQTHVLARQCGEHGWETL